MNYSEDRSFLRNFCYFLVAILGIYIVPIFVSSFASKFIHNDLVLDIVSDLLFILILFLIYEKIWNLDGSLLRKQGRLVR